MKVGWRRRNAWKVPFRDGQTLWCWKSPKGLRVYRIGRR